MTKPPFNMTTSVTFDRSLIAPCGMNCGTCIAYLRTKNRCIGCWIDSHETRKACAQCRVRNCDLLEKTDSKFCYDCDKFPCLRIKQLDKRYRTKYRTSFIENLLMIKENGINYFLAFESKRRTCSNCGSTLSVHQNNCLTCNLDLKHNAL
jgi:hypothetical protein